MEKLNSYYGSAKNDLLYVRASFDACDSVQSYNAYVALCANVAEKFLKAVIETCFVDDEDAMSLLHSHNMRSLYNKIVIKYKLSVDSKSCKWLGDFYFDARYPGDNFVVASREDAIECQQILESIFKDVTDILNQQRIENEKKLKELDSFRAFQHTDR